MYSRLVPRSTLTVPLLLLSQPKLYRSVIEDVINEVRELFLDEGVDEQVLMELKTVLNSSSFSVMALTQKYFLKPCILYIMLTYLLCLCNNAVITRNKCISIYYTHAHICGNNAVITASNVF